MPRCSGRGDLFDLAYIERNVYGDPTGYKNLKTLRRKLGDAMYRKSVDDPDVAPFMPGRRFLDWTYRMDTATRELYTRMAWDLKRELDEATGPARRLMRRCIMPGASGPTRPLPSARPWPSTRRWRCCWTTRT